MESRGDCFQAVEEVPIENKGPSGVPENSKSEEITRTEDNGSEHAAKAIVDGTSYNSQTMGSDDWNFGSTRKQKEWTRTLACKLFEEKHSYNVDGDGEAMDLLWEVFETDSEVKSGLKEGESNSSGYCYYDEQELNAQVYCFQTLKLTTEKMNLGRGRPNPNLVKNISKVLGWLRYIRARLDKK
ncbi:hypothetical protein V6N13_087376 [Hibiscus sabdariffa]|uniref:Uncharacterized protein n=1 Tax=Hibiscus sabdariffa TaxID=183260 RepID=A0ABR2FW17_9ROSI